MLEGITCGRARCKDLPSFRLFVPLEQPKRVAGIFPDFADEIGTFLARFQFAQRELRARGYILDGLVIFIFIYVSLCIFIFLYVHQRLGGRSCYSTFLKSATNIRS
jgi:hypothetical protein